MNNDAYLLKLKAAERAMEKFASGRVQSSADLIERVQSSKKYFDSDIVRMAYWTLVDRGSLIRTPYGVRKRRKGE